VFLEAYTIFVCHLKTTQHVFPIVISRKKVASNPRVRIAQLASKLALGRSFEDLGGGEVARKATNQ